MESKVVLLGSLADEIAVVEGALEGKSENIFCKIDAKGDVSKGSITQEIEELLGAFRYRIALMIPGHLPLLFVYFYRTFYRKDHFVPYDIDVTQHWHLDQYSFVACSGGIARTEVCVGEVDWENGPPYSYTEIPEKVDQAIESGRARVEEIPYGTLFLATEKTFHRRAPVIPEGGHRIFLRAEFQEPRRVRGSR